MANPNDAWKDQKQACQPLLEKIQGSVESLRGGWLAVTYPTCWGTHLPITRKLHGWHAVRLFLARLIEQRKNRGLL